MTNSDPGYDFAMTLMVRAKGLSSLPEELTAHLGIQPTRWSYKGDNFAYTPEGKTSPYRLTIPRNGWLFATPLVDEMEFEEHWPILLSAIEGKQDLFKSAVGKHVDHFELNVHTSIGRGECPPTIRLAPDQLRMIYDFGFTLEFSIH